MLRVAGVFLWIAAFSCASLIALRYNFCSQEGFGLGRQRPGVDLYSRKVLIEAESKIMPEWLRFMQGVVDSEDIPLNVSREFMQDSALMRRIRTVLTRRVLRFLETEMKRNRKGFEKFFAEHGTYLKEGACAEQIYQNDIGKLLLFESSELPAGQLTTLDEYVSRTAPGQGQIYYLVAPHRGLANKSPYMESFTSNKTNGHQATEVLYLYQPIDDFVMDNLKAYNGRQLITIESSDIKMNHIDHQAVEKEAAKSAESDKASAEDSSTSLPGVPARLAEHQVRQLSDWLMNTALPRRLKAVKASTRLVDTPAVITDHESSSMRRMMRMLDMQQRDSEAPRAEESMLPKQTLEINPSHPVICRLHSLSKQQPTVAVLVAQQLFDNTLMAAGLMDDSRTMLPRLTTLMETLLGSVIERDAATGGHRMGVDLDSEGKADRFESADETHQKASTEAAHDSAIEAALRAKIAGETGGLKDVPDVLKSSTVTAEGVTSER
jgi:HSP90 family molecular chaperone